MPYPEEAEGFQIDGSDTHTQFHKRHVRTYIPWHPLCPVQTYL